MKSKKTRPGFTLVELLTVIAIIGILAALLFPQIGKFMKRGQQTAALSNIRNIATSHLEIAISTVSPKIVGLDKHGKPAKNTNEWAIDLAKLGGLNNAKMYYAGSFQPLGEDMPEKIYSSINDEENIDFKNSTRIAYDVVTGLSSPADLTTCTLIWTTDGGAIFKGPKWNRGSPWGELGGHVAYCDGHVLYFDKTQNKFTNYETDRPTSDPGLANPSKTPGAYSKVIGPKSLIAD